MKKGEVTRQSVLEHAFQRAARLGLEGLTIGGLAEETGLSKSGLFAHFESKEALQLAVIDFAAARFVERVIKPTLKAPRGEPRLRALLANWLVWESQDARDGGCFFAAAAFELDGRPGPVRDRVVQLQRDFLELIANVARTGINEGHFAPHSDPDEVAFQLYGIMLVTQHYTRLLGDRKAHARAQTSFETLLGGIRAPAAGTKRPAARSLT